MSHFDHFGSMQHHVDSLICPILIHFADDPPVPKKPCGEAKGYQPIQPRNRGRRWRPKTQQTKKVARLRSVGYPMTEQTPLFDYSSCLLLLWWHFPCAFVRIFFVVKAMIHCSNMEEKSAAGTKSIASPTQTWCSHYMPHGPQHLIEDNRLLVWSTRKNTAGGFQMHDI